jgi:hypothetical protein
LTSGWLDGRPDAAYLRAMPSIRRLILADVVSDPAIVEHLIA